MNKRNNLLRWSLGVWVAVWLGGSAGRAATFNISVGDNFFNPSSKTINVGDTVVWTWTGFSTHNVTSSSSPFVLASGNKGNGGTFSFTFNSAGTFPYVCTIHAGQIGTITVQSNPAPTITSVPNQTIARNSMTASLPFTIGDPDTPIGNLLLSSSSGNLALVPSANIAIAGSGANRAVTVTPAPNQSGSATISIAVSDGVNTTTTSFSLVVNDPPTISAISNQLINKNTALSNLPILIGDIETAVGSLSLSVTASNSSLFPTANLVTGGSGANRTLTLTPALDQTGVSSILVAVTDGTYTNITVFTMTVNDPPTLSSIANLLVLRNGSVSGIPFTVGDTESPSSALSVSGTSGNTALVSDANIVFGGTGANRTVTITPAQNLSGTAAITVSVNDGSAITSKSFTVVVNDPPTIAAIPNQLINKNTSLSNLPVLITDVETVPGNLTMSIASSNPVLFPLANISTSGSGANRTLTLTPALDQVGVSSISVAVTDGTYTNVAVFTLTVNDPPTFSNLPNQLIVRGGSVLGIPFTVADSETPSVGLVVSGTSGNAALIPDSNIMFGGTGANRTISITAMPNVSGTALIAVNVNDGSATTSKTFTVVVNDPPTISSIANQIALRNTTLSNIPFIVADTESAAASLSVTGSSSNTGLVPNGNIVIAGTGANRSVSVAPLANQSGTCIVTLVVSDGISIGSTSFALTVNVPPVVSITAPTNITTLLAGSSPTIQGTATDSDGSVVRVDLYASGLLIGSVTSAPFAPFSFTATSVPAGNYLLTAVATDNLGASNTSAAVSIQVLTNATLVPTSFSLSAASFTVSNSIMGQTYFLDAFTNFSAGAFGARWFPIATNTAASNNFQFTDGVLTEPVPRLYRVRQTY